MQEGSPLFTVHAFVPVAESFGFADELRRWTAGASSALLVLSHWEALAEDPFFVPKTEEEIEEFGDGDDDWDKDFTGVLIALVEDRAYSVTSVDPTTGDSELLHQAKLSDIQGFLAYNDQMRLVINLGEKTITFTGGHEILWLNGFSMDIIDALPFSIERISNNRIGELF